MNQDIFLKFSAFVHHMSVLNWQQNFCCCSISLPATAHFGQNFGWLYRPYLLNFSFFFSKKKIPTKRLLELSKFLAKWAVAGRLIEQQQIFCCQFSTDMWWTNAESFKKNSWFIFKSLQKNWFYHLALAPVLVTLNRSAQHRG